MKSASWLALVVSLAASTLAAPGVARAAPSDVCLTAPVDGQKLRRAGKLLEARKAFTLCAHEACPREVVQACTRWEHEVEASLPTVVFAVRDDSGADVVARVRIDSDAAMDVGARAIELDPGEHRLVFDKAGGGSIEQRVVIREGEKNRVVTATFPAPPTAPPRRPPPAPPAPAERSWWTSLRTTGAIVGGVGGATLLTGFGLAGLAKANYGSARDRCAAPDDCPRTAVEESDRARALGDTATVVVIAGAGVLLVGAALLLFAPAPRDHAGARRGWTLGGGTTSVGLTGSW